MTQESEIRRRPDGSIDTAHYMALSRRLRADAARSMARKVAMPTLASRLVPEAFPWGRRPAKG